MRCVAVVVLVVWVVGFTFVSCLFGCLLIVLDIDLLCIACMFGDFLLCSFGCLLVVLWVYICVYGDCLVCSVFVLLFGCFALGCRCVVFIWLGFG